VITLEGGRVASDLTIDLPRPRDRTSLGFTQLVAAVLDGVLGGPGFRPAVPVRSLVSVP
jgi:hypothetical protein